MFISLTCILFSEHLLGLLFSRWFVTKQIKSNLERFKLSKVIKKKCELWIFETVQMQIYLLGLLYNTSIFLSDNLSSITVHWIIIYLVK